MGSPGGYDAVVVGTGSGGKIAALDLARAGRRVAVVEAGRIGGECPYVACIPAKSLLLSGRAGRSWEQAVEARDAVSAHREDAAAAQELADEGIDIVRGRGRLAGRDPAGIEVVVSAESRADRRLMAPVVILGTGSRPVRPPIEGLDRVPTWTSDEALSAYRQPSRLAILGGGAVGCELAQAFARLGTAVTVLEVAPGLLPGEAPWVGELVGEVLRADGVDVRVGADVRRLQPRVQTGLRVELADGSAVDADRLLLAGGRRPASDDLGLAELSVEPGDSGAIGIDARCRVLDGAGRVVPGLFAVGDVTAESSYTHSANLQARVVVAELLGHGYDGDYTAVPRAVYVDPAVFCVGLTPDAARDKGIRTISATFDVADVARASLVEHSDPAGRKVRGRVEVLADASDGVIVGASCVGPEADSWGAELALAVRARVTVELMARHIRAFPTWSEAIYPAISSLAEQLASSPSLHQFQPPGSESVR